MILVPVNTHGPTPLAPPQGFCFFYLTSWALRFRGRRGEVATLPVPRLEGRRCGESTYLPVATLRSSLPLLGGRGFFFADCEQVFKVV